MGSCQMERIGECNGVTLYFADSRFERPGVYYWNGTDNVRAWPEEEHQPPSGASQSSNPNPVTPGLSSESGASVIERARNFLAGEVAHDYPKMARALVAGKSMESYVLVPHCLRAIERALSSPRQEGEVLARGWFHALPDDDDYEFHDDASGAGKNCDGCIRAMIVAEGGTAASTQGEPKVDN